MINSYNTNLQEVLNNEALVFSTNRILTGSTVTHSEGSQVFNLNKPGYYYVSFNGIVDSEEGATIQLYNSNEAVPGAVAATTATNQEENIAFSTIVKVIPSCCYIDNKAKLTFVNKGTDATLINANVVITKLC